ncbi:raf homolog serine/threonine-protein kinase phl-like isoform X3 [Limulus polyphemus]|uniref:Raf homolog serine/threonine-protein kinase phl-like isoform X3 n=1 Tax=Limulus polyphemus TaxID=6850 RepID=A0ABM1SNQ0_LIMPO|nr:raf homolog serine/threonine-protein kinase phl-like isoform X3 [Limulus polyphemus]
MQTAGANNMTLTVCSPPVEELQNIRSMIRLTRGNLEALNAKFAQYQHPPSMYITEFEDLNSKLNEFQLQEQRLVDQLSNGSNGRDSPEQSDPDYDESRMYPEIATPRETLTSNSSQASLSSCSTGTLPDGTRLTPKSPLKVVRAFLPYQQRSTVQVRPGQTIQEALSKAMERRHLTPHMCVVYRCNPRVRIEWDTDITSLEGEEITVEIRERFPITTSISHNFARKTFFSLAFCECCRGILFHGFRCQTCGYRFHQRCAANVPTLCQPLRVDHIYKQLLAMNNTASNMLQTTGDSYSPYASNYQYQRQPAVTSPPKNVPRSHPPPLGQRERSTSAPNVCYNTVNHDMTLEEFALRLRSQNVPGVSSPLTPRYEIFSRFHTHKGSPTHSPVPKRRQLELPCPGGSPGSLALPYQQSSASTNHSPSSSPTRTQSAQGSPTNIHKPWRPRARSADESSKKVQRTTRESIEDWEIPANEILTGPRIGSGSFGTVYRAHWHGPVALKKLNVTDPTAAQLQAFKNEVAVLRKTRHVNILLFMGWVSKPHLTIVTQWCEGSSLYKHLYVQECKFEMVELINIARQTAQGMDYLHAKNIIHRDLKSNNIFLHEDWTVKIGDFGLATVKTRWSGSEQFNQPTGSILWMAPEVIRMKDSHPYSFQSDVYAFGIVLYELIAGQLPYARINNRDQILFMVGHGYLRPDLSNARSDTPKALIRLIEDCVKFNREERPLFRQILASLELLARSLPKIHRSTSEPTLNRTHLQSEDFTYICASPKTPSQFGAFPFF